MHSWGGLRVLKKLFYFKLLKNGSEPIRLAHSHWPIITGKSQNHVSHYGSYTHLITNIPIAMGEMFN